MTAIEHNGKTICQNAKLCDGWISRLVGLMFSNPSAAILKANRESINGTSIHTFFMRFPIDVIWLNENLEIVDLRKNVRPYQVLVIPSRKAMYVLEVPSGEDMQIKIGDKVEI